MAGPARRRRRATGQLAAAARLDELRVEAQEGRAEGPLEARAPARAVGELDVPGGALRAAFGADGTRVVTVGADGAVRVYDASTGDPSFILGRHLGTASRVSLSPDGRALATSDGFRVVKIWAFDVDLLRQLEREELTRALTEEECRRSLGTGPVLFRGHQADASAIGAAHPPHTRVRRLGDAHPAATRRLTSWISGRVESLSRSPSGSASR